jgi:uncharacterized protein YbjT (DUF2867 family)
MDVILFGASGMIGSGVLLECLRDPRVRSVLSVGRSATGRSHPKLREVVRDDFLQYGDMEEDLGGHQACFFCLGVSAAGMSEEAYHRVTHDLTLATARALVELNPGLTFCYVSGEGTDSSETSRIMWARVKGKTENRLLELPTETYMFRPGFVQPVEGVRSKTGLYRALYAVAAPLYPIIRRIAPTHVTTSVNLGKAMIRVGVEGYARDVLENVDINALAEIPRTTEPS